MLPDPSIKPRIYVDSPRSLQAAFHELIPLSRSMGVRVKQYTGDTLVLTAPLSKNINHQHSAFGGSLFALGALAGWGLMQLKLSELLLDCNTVVMGGEVSFQRPVYDDLLCTATLPADAGAMFERLAAEGRASTVLESRYECDGDTAMLLTGRYHLKQRAHSADA